MNLLAAILTFLSAGGAVLYTNEPSPLPLNAGMIPTNTALPLVARTRQINTSIPLPGGGYQTFHTYARMLAAATNATPRQISFLLSCPAQASSYALYVSMDLTNWAMIKTTTNLPLVVTECLPAKQRFWLLSPQP